MNHVRIIIIDDNPDIHRDFINILTISNTAAQIAEIDTELFGEEKTNGSNKIPEFNIETASQGEEGIAKIKKALEDDNPFALAFVDIRMPPGIDGIETIKKIWEFDRDIQIAICTAYSDYSWEDTVKALGLTENLLVLKKPFDIVAVKQLATALTQKWLSSRDTKQHTFALNQLVQEHRESLVESSALLRATIESSSDGVLVLDLNNQIIDFNHQFIEFMGITKSLLKKNDGKKLFQHILNHLDTANESKHLLDIFKHQMDGSSTEIIRLKNKKVFKCNSKPHRIRSRTVGRVWTFHDITEQISLKEKLEFQSLHDALTGLSNRSLLRDRLEQEIARAFRNNTQFAVLFLDLDRFKFVNDTLSHEMGDRLLCAVAKRLLSMRRKMDTIARLGGDEFILVFPSIKDLTQINTIAHKFLKIFEKPFSIAKHKIKINASIGISIYPQNGTRVNTLLSNADLAMYQAKAQGGNQFFFFTHELNKKSEYFYKMQSELQAAVDKHEFFLVYQPQFAMNQRDILSIEALLRWQHPKRGIVSPLEFVPLAESSGLIINIGQWVIEEGCKQLLKWHHQGFPKLKIAINAATKQLRLFSFPNTVEQILKKIGLHPSFLEIEITETVIIDQQVQQNIRKLKKLGCGIVLDDFGTGNASLGTLKDLQIDGIKIDRSFVNNISKSQGDEAIVDAIIAISHSLDFKVIAEGVETQTQIDFLRKKNCDEIQGYLGSKPLSAMELEHLLKGTKHYLY